MVRTTAAILAGLVAIALIASATLAPDPTTGSTESLDASLAASPTMATSCGQFADSWGSGTVGDIEVRLLSVAENPPSKATPPASPPDGHHFYVELEIENRSNQEVTIHPADFTLTLCDGQQIQSPDSEGGTALTISLEPGSTMGGWQMFLLPEGGEPARLTVSIPLPDVTGARVEFPLVISGCSDSAAVGADAFGGDGADGADATGRDVTGADGQGGDAQGGDATGGDAVGGDAVGGDGADGGDAIAGSAEGASGDDDSDPDSISAQEACATPS